MKTRYVVAVAAVLLCCGADWPQFRGQPGSILPIDQPVPTTWSTKKNVAWVVELGGRGVSSPIVVHGRVIVTSSTGFAQDRLHVICLAANSGQRVWERQFWATGRTSCHPKTSVSAPTPASDGERIFAFYSTNDLACLDLEGNLLWYRGLTYDFPQASNSLGMASSPVVADETVVVQVESDSEAFAMGLDVHTGLTRWKLGRTRKANWCSPIAWQRSQFGSVIVLQSSSGVTVVRPKTGDVLGQFDQGASTISSSSVFGDTLLAPSNGLTALELAPAERQLIVRWQENRLRPTTSSPLVQGRRVYVMSGSILRCGDVTTGRLIWQLRLAGPFSSSPVAAQRNLYAFNEDGLGFVVRLGEQGKVLSQNDLGEMILATPAIADGALYVRGVRHLWKIAPSD